ncbi:MAG: AMP-binding protein [Verrucomicrobiales bacterium]|nr:AMP-binding protein [Verrucomicrobiales bacterium]
MIKRVLLLLARIFFRHRANNTAALKTPGPVLLLSNHASWLDWLFLGVHLDDDWRFVTSIETAQTSWLHRFIMVNRRTFPIEVASPYAVKRMAEFLEKGGRLVLFPEGRLSRTGALMKLFDGTGFLIFKTRAKVITAHLRGAQRVPFSPHPGWRRLFTPVTAHFSNALDAPHPGNVSTSAARTMLTAWLRDTMVRQHFDVESEFGPRHLLDAIVETACRRPGFEVLRDTTRQRLTYRRLLVGTRLLAEQWRQLLLAETPRVGVLLPNVNATPVTILSLWASGHIPALLNYSTGTPVMLKCCELAGLRQIITSRAFLQRAKIDPSPFAQAGIELVYLDDVRQRIPSFRRLVTLLASILDRSLGLSGSAFRSGTDETAVILFTSGSEGLPKGVELSHGNLLANLRQLLAVLDIVDTDRFFNALPLFHSFGVMAGIVAPLVRGISCFLYPSPLHYRIVPTLVYDLNCTVMFGTPTFLNGYARKAHPYDFRTVRLLVAGAEKLQESTFLTYARKFGVRILEGYGATECSPVVCINSPLEPRAGSVGRFVPGLEWRLEPMDGVPVGGRLLVRGPNVMRGYLNADANAKFQALGGWYDTGDIVNVDADGFAFILGRLKRFAKISGEMVSLTAVEDALAGAFPQFGLRCQVAVVAVPDDEKGERLIAASNESKLTLEDLRTVIRGKGFSNLCVPRELRFVKEIPKLGTGKINHRELASLVGRTEPPTTTSSPQPISIG